VESLAGATKTQSKRRTFIVAAIIGAVAAFLGYAAIVGMRERSTLVLTVPKEALMYPGAQSVVDMANTDGSLTIQLETPDSLDKVERWYQTSLPFTKFVRLTSASVVMKNQNLTITLANEDNKTVILIKKLP
jgi:hypothetical protein